MCDNNDDTKVRFLSYILFTNWLNILYSVIVHLCPVMRQNHSEDYWTFSVCRQASDYQKPLRQRNTNPPPTPEPRSLGNQAQPRPVDKGNAIE